MCLVKEEEFDRYKLWSLEILAKLKRTMHRIESLSLIELLMRLYSHILPVIWRSLEHLQTHDNFLLGINGMQGSGKTTIALIL
jgi:pantothenate kinase-related protein Tda10